MVDVRPFRALRPAPEHAAAVISPPYDVLDDAEARRLASDPRSFLHVTRPEVGMPHGTLPAQRVVWERGRDQLRRLMQDGTLQREPYPSYYVYALTTATHRQTGFIAACSVREYEEGVIREHEHTLPEKEDDRTRHLETLDAQVGLVFLAYRADAALADLARRIAAAPPLWRATTTDGIEHALWVAPQELNEPVAAAFAALPALYIADGHHRSAAASRVHRSRGTDPTARFLAGLFPDDALQVLGYHRVVTDLRGHNATTLLDALDAAGFDVVTGSSLPPARGHVAMYLDGAWYLVRPRDGLVDVADPVASLDTAWLQHALLAPVFGIVDPRTAPELRFIGGHRDPDAIAAEVDEDGGVAFLLHPTGMDQLFAVADAGKMMPPKSTWFEPKLREGVAVRLLDEP